MYKIPTIEIWKQIETTFINQFLKNKPEGATSEQVSEILSVYAFEFSRA
jgi:hypothetical protein